MVRIAASLLGLAALTGALPTGEILKSGKPARVAQPAPQSPPPAPSPPPPSPPPPSPPPASPPAASPPPPSAAASPSSKVAATSAGSSCSASSLLCQLLPLGLDTCACNYLTGVLGLASLGANPQANNGEAWIGPGGPNTYTFTNGASSDVVVIMWTQAGGYSSSFVKSVAPAISYSLPQGATVTISLADGVSGAFAPIHQGSTQLTGDGQIQNTWLEFTTGSYGTFDVSREVFMNGNAISATGSGCTSDMNTCVFTCLSGTTCGAAGSYQLENCANGSQPGSTFGTFGGQPSGGCQSGNAVTVHLGD